MEEDWDRESRIRQSRFSSAGIDYSSINGDKASYNSPGIILVHNDKECLVIKRKSNKNSTPGIFLYPKNTIFQDPDSFLIDPSKKVCLFFLGPKTASIYEKDYLTQALIKREGFSLDANTSSYIFKKTLEFNALYRLEVRDSSGVTVVGFINNNSLFRIKPSSKVQKERLIYEGDFDEVEVKQIINLLDQYKVITTQNSDSEKTNEIVYPIKSLQLSKDYREKIKCEELLKALRALLGLDFEVHIIESDYYINQIV